MTEEKKTEETFDIGDSWETLPRAAKNIVYAHLRQAEAKYGRKAAAASVARQAALSMEREEDAMQAAAVELAHLSVVMAFTCAVEELEAADPEICPDCGGYHEPDEPSKHDVS